jgi:hypothetical protein
MEYPPSLPILLCSFLSLAGAIIGIYRIHRRVAYTYCQNLQALMLASMSLYTLFVALIGTDFYLRFPHLWRIFTSLAYVNVPLAFLYVRSSLLNRQSFKKSDLWFALPLAIPILNMFPFFFEDTDTKLEVIRNVIRDPDLFALEKEGLLSSGFASWIRAIINISLNNGHLLLLASAIHHFRNMDSPGSAIDKRKYLWLCTLAIVFLLVSLLTLLQFAFRIFPGLDFLQSITWSGVLMILIVLGQLIFDPRTNRNFSRPLPASELFF